MVFAASVNHCIASAGSDAESTPPEIGRDPIRADVISLTCGGVRIRESEYRCPDTASTQTSPDGHSLELLTGDRGSFDEPHAHEAELDFVHGVEPGVQRERQFNRRDARSDRSMSS